MNIYIYIYEYIYIYKTKIKTYLLIYGVYTYIA